VLKTGVAELTHFDGSQRVEGMRLRLKWAVEQRVIEGEAEMCIN
jgi:hypothetical protein